MILFKWHENEQVIVLHLVACSTYLAHANLQPFPWSNSGCCCWMALNRSQRDKPIRRVLISRAKTSVTFFWGGRGGGLTSIPFSAQMPSQLFLIPPQTLNPLHPLPEVDDTLWRTRGPRQAQNRDVTPTSFCFVCSFLPAHFTHASNGFVPCFVFVLFFSCLICFDWIAFGWSIESRSASLAMHRLSTDLCRWTDAPSYTIR